jgi:hypothetical protein
VCRLVFKYLRAFEWVAMVPWKRAMSFEFAFFGRNLSPPELPPMRDQISPFLAIDIGNGLCCYDHGMKAKKNNQFNPKTQAGKEDILWKKDKEDLVDVLGCGYLPRPYCDQLSAG